MRPGLGTIVAAPWFSKDCSLPGHQHHSEPCANCTRSDSAQNHGTRNSGSEAPVCIRSSSPGGLQLMGDAQSSSRRMTQSSPRSRSQHAQCLSSSQDARWSPLPRSLPRDPPECHPEQIPAGLCHSASLQSQCLGLKPN